MDWQRRKAREQARKITPPPTVRLDQQSLRSYCISRSSAYSLLRAQSGLKHVSNYQLRQAIIEGPGKYQCQWLGYNRLSDPARDETMSELAYCYSPKGRIRVHRLARTGLFSFTIRELWRCPLCQDFLRNDYNGSYYSCLIYEGIDAVCPDCFEAPECAVCHRWTRNAGVMPVAYDWTRSKNYLKYKKILVCDPCSDAVVASNHRFQWCLDTQQLIRELQHAASQSTQKSYPHSQIQRSIIPSQKA